MTDADIPKNICVDSIVDIRDGLTREERVVLYCLKQAQDEFKGRSVPTITLYGRVCEFMQISPQRFQQLIANLVNGGGN